jgi:hypothetical protein
LLANLAIGRTGDAEFDRLDSAITFGGVLAGLAAGGMPAAPDDCAHVLPVHVLPGSRAAFPRRTIL